MRNDGKDRFYRTLDLDSVSKQALKFFRNHVEELKEEIDDEQEDKQNT